ncbi:MAG: alpha-glucosidase/alpha-galactosidase [Kiritimatiellae bacterium]|nr:alpha-glucosidase/alpha-galactosidase [Kiritimatiellia bacterium]
MKVAFIGAGSLGFTRKVLADILTVPEFRDTTQIAFTDISRRNLARVTKLCRRDMAANGVKSKLTATLDRRAALKGAHYVICVVRVGGLEAFQTDVDIPLKYGVDQCVGDTLSAGGIMYAQRSIPVLREFCRDISEVAAPGCYFISHVNPMAMNTWACTAHGYGVNVIGLCHGVEGGHRQIANVLGKKASEVDIICAGINHLGWYVQVKVKGRDMTGRLLKAFEKHPRYRETEKVRIDMLRRFGYYCTESNGHCSEYVPWYRKREKEIRNWIDTSSWIHGETGGYLRVCRENRDWFKTDFPGWMKAPPREYLPAKRTGEHGSYIMEAMETGRIYRGHFNVPNQGCITNLPDDCIIEAPGYVDRNGLSVPLVGDLPAGCAAVCNTNINAQRLAVQAAVTGDDELLRQAMMVDPLVGAVCNPPEIWQMVDEMLVAQARWLPQYRKAAAAARRRLAKGKTVRTREHYRGAVRFKVKSGAQKAREVKARQKKRSA